MWLNHILRDKRNLMCHFQSQNLKHSKENVESESDGAVVIRVLLGLVEGDDLRLRALPAFLPAATRLKEGLHVLLRDPGHHTR